MESPKDPVEVVHWDDEKLPAELVAELQKGPTSFRGSFPDARIGLGAFTRSPNKRVPRILITDMIGLGLDETGKCLTQRVRQECPLTVVLLYSRQAGYDLSQEQREALRRERKFDDVVFKTDVGAVMQRVRDWSARMAGGIVARFGEYVLSRAEQAGVKFSPDGKGGLLSLIDLYAEMVIGSDVGQEAAKIWEWMLDNKPQRPEGVVPARALARRSSPVPSREA
jgi:hypothetical protein